MPDGDDWTLCGRGHRHWGTHGAAGLLVVAPDDEGLPRVLLQHRAPWSHHGDTWGVPGGARASHESAREAALREAGEETGLDTGRVVPAAEYLDDHGGWSYTTVIATAREPLPVHAQDRESTAVAWVRVGDVVALELHPGFAATWERVRRLL